LLRTDNGGEFCSHVFDDYCRKEGIVRHHTIPYTPQQNGVAERMNRTIISKARCMLSNARMNKSFWAEAGNTACYLINRSPSIPLNKKTPIEDGPAHLLIIHSLEFLAALLTHMSIMENWSLELLSFYFLVMFRE
jgi:transposase InsO family protein